MLSKGKCKRRKKMQKFTVFPTVRVQPTSAFSLQKNMRNALWNEKVYKQHLISSLSIVDDGAGSWAVKNLFKLFFCPPSLSSHSESFWVSKNETVPFFFPFTFFCSDGIFSPSIATMSLSLLYKFMLSHKYFRSFFLCKHHPLLSAAIYLRSIEHLKLLSFSSRNISAVQWNWEMSEKTRVKIALSCANIFFLRELISSHRAAHTVVVHTLRASRGYSRKFLEQSRRRDSNERWKCYKNNLHSGSRFERERMRGAKSKAINKISPSR